MRVPLAVLALSSLLFAQRRPPGTIVRGPLGASCAAAVSAAAPDYWGAVLVATDGEVVFARGHGPLDRSEGTRARAMSSRSVFDLGGASALLTGIVALRLERSGKLRRTDGVGRFLDDWPADKEGITLERLLAHRSGLPADAPWGGSSADNARAAAAAIGRAKLRGAPGGDSAYSALDGILLALVCEEAAGRHFDRLLSELVCKPFGMKGAGPTGSRFGKRLVTVRRKKGESSGEPADRLRYNWRQRGARAVLASVHDVHALLDGLASGRWLDRKDTDLLLAPLDKGGLRVLKMRRGETGLVRVEGYAKGYKTWWTLHRPSRSWIVQCTSDEGKPLAIETALLDVLDPAFEAAGSEPATDTPAEPDPAEEVGTEPAAAAAIRQPDVQAAWIDRFVGSFVMPSGGGLELKRVGDRLRLSARGLEASVRVLEGRWPGRLGDRAARAEDRGLSLIERLLAGDPTAVDEAFADEAAADAGSSALASLLASRGPLRRVEFVGAARSGRRLLSWFRILGERGTGDLVVHWRDERRFARLALADRPAPFAVDVVVEGPDRARATARDGTPIVLTIEGKPGARTLVFEDATAGREGLLDCPETAN